MDRLPDSHKRPRQRVRRCQPLSRPGRSGYAEAVVGTKANGAAIP